MLDEIEVKLGIKVRPLTWPIGMGPDLKGVYNLYEKSLILYMPNSTERVSETLAISDISDSELDNQIGDEDAEMLREEVELVESVYPEFDRSVYLDGEVSPVFFGSAINTFGVQELLHCFWILLLHLYQKNLKKE